MAKKTKTIGIKLIFAWIFFILFVLAGVASIFTANILQGIFYILAGIVISPPFAKSLKEKADIEITTWLKLLIVLILLVVGGMFSPNC